MNDSAQALCPSSPAVVGAKLLAAVGPTGKVANFPVPLTVDGDFLQRARTLGPLEKRFRFASPCQQGNCVHWAGSECGLIGRLHKAGEEKALLQPSDSLVPCGIRSSCRWWRQEGRRACSVCAVVVTDQR